MGSTTSWGDNLDKMTKNCMKMTKWAFLGQNSGGGGGVGDKGEGDIGADIGADTFGRRHWRKIIIITMIHFMTIDFDLSTKYKRDIRLHNEI